MASESTIIKYQGSVTICGVRYMENSDHRLRLTINYDIRFSENDIYGSATIYKMNSQAHKLFFR